LKQYARHVCRSFDDTSLRNYTCYIYKTLDVTLLKLNSARAVADTCSITW